MFWNSGRSQGAPKHDPLFALCRHCGKVVAAAPTGARHDTPVCGCGATQNFVSALERAQQQLAG